MEPVRTRERERRVSPPGREIKRMEPKLYSAAKSGDFNCLTTMSGYPGILNQTTPIGNNLFHVATQHEQVDFIKQLLDKCPPSGQSLLLQGNHNGDTPLHVAAKVGSHSLCEIFIDFGRTLVSDIEGGHVDRQQELLRMVNVDKDTVLHYAVRYQNSSIVKLLIDKDPELCDVVNAADESPLYLATALGSFEITKNILDDPLQSFCHKGPRGMTALHAAIYYKLHAYNFVKAIVERRWQMIRERDDIGWTPLHYAACYDKVEAVQLFLQHDDSAAYLLDNDGESALHIAAFLGHIDVVKELIESLPDACELINDKGQTALHTAAIGGRLNVIKFILKTHIFKHLINKQDKDGNTAIHLAAVHQRYDIVNFLARDRRVDIGLSNKEHKTALGIYDKEEEAVELSVYKELKMKFGVQFMQDQAIECVKKRLKNESAQGRSATSTTTINNNTSEQEKVYPSKESAIEISKVTATLIAAVTFSAVFTVPGGFTSQGTANFAGKAAFRLFVLSNTIAFYFSLLAVYCQFVLTSGTKEPRRKYRVLARLYRFYLPVAIIGMGVAFACGTCLVIPKTDAEEQVFPRYILVASVCFFAGVFVQYAFIFHRARRIIRYILKRIGAAACYEYGVKPLR